MSISGTIFVKHLCAYCLIRKFHLHWMMCHTLEMQKLKTGKDPGISGAWLHTHKLHRGTDEEQICSQRTADHWVSKILQLSSLLSSCEICA